MIGPKRFGQLPPGSGRVAVGIDQSYSGFAICALNHSGFSATVYKGKGTGVARLLDLQRFLTTTFDTLIEGHGDIHRVAIEGYAFSSQMAHMAGELGGMVKMTLWDLGITPLVVSPTSLKKYVTGKGNVKKQQILLQTYKKWGVELTDDNAADAYGLSRIAARMAALKYEDEVLDKIYAQEFRDHLPL